MWHVVFMANPDKKRIGLFDARERLNERLREVRLRAFAELRRLGMTEAEIHDLLARKARRRPKR